jgi:hypothetical protein
MSPVAIVAATVVVFVLGFALGVIAAAMKTQG